MKRITMNKNLSIVIGFFVIITWIALYQLSRQDISAVERSSRECQTDWNLTSLADFKYILEDESCPKLQTLNNIFTIHLEIVNFRLMHSREPPDLKKANPPTLQSVVEVTNKFTGETSRYNPYRANRPGAQKRQSKENVEQLIESSMHNCDFCRPEQTTAEETWGRIRTNSTISAANKFPLVGPNNGLIIPNRHNPIDLSESELFDMFENARLWYQKIYNINPHQKYPMLIWDTLHHAGASQIHTHAQIWLGEEYTGVFNLAYNAAKKYRSEIGRDYWSDLKRVHLDLGLGVRYREVTVITPLHSHKDYEVLIISPDLSKDFLHVLYSVLEIYNKDLNLFCRSMGISFPPLDPTVAGKHYFPLVARIGSRGDCSSSVSDVSSLELYAFYSINSDPLQLIRLLRSRISDS